MTRARLTAVAAAAGLLAAALILPGVLGANRSVHANVAKAVRANFAVFRTAHPVRQSEAARWQRIAFGGKAKSAQASQTIVVEHPDSRTRILVIGDGDRVCVADEVGGFACAPSAGVVAGNLMGAHYCAEKLAAGYVRFYGLIPDSARNVTLVTATGRVPLSVTQNVYAIETAAHPLRVEWRDDNGTQSATTPTPNPATIPCHPAAAGGNPLDKESSDG